MGTTEAQAGAEGLEITELEKFEVTRVDGVASPANGFPVLLMKALAPAEPAAADGTGPAAGVPEGITAQAGQAAKAILDAYASIDGPWEYPADEALAKAHREFSAAERRRHATAGNALPDGSYPIPDADALRRAAILARSKHGNWKAAARLIGRRARELGVKNPMKKKKPGNDGDADDASKGTVAKQEAGVDTGTGTDSLAKAVGDAVTKATEPLAREIAELKSAKDHLEGELAKVLALPQPGGPVLSVTRPGTDGAAVKKTRLLAKAEEYEELARTMTSPSDADAYAKLAAQARGEAAQLG